MLSQLAQQCCAKMALNVMCSLADDETLAALQQNEVGPMCVSKVEDPVDHTRREQCLGQAASS